MRKGAIYMDMLVNLNRLPALAVPEVLWPGIFPIGWMNAPWL